jgi:hypothetical protein
MSKIEVNAIEPQCGTTLTLGANNDTVTLGTGAAFSGGIGAVKWETTPQTGSFAAAAGRGYFMNTTSGALTVTLPAGSAGAIVAIADYAATFQTNNLTVSPNGTDKIGGTNASVVLETEGQSVTFLFVDSTQGWINVQDSTSNERANAFIEATGGTITTSGNDKIHTFTGPGTFTVTNVAACSANNIMSHVVVAGGGGGARGCRVGGGGAGGYREVKSPVTPYTASPLDGYPSAPNRVTISSPGSIPITVGGGGAAGSSGPFVPGISGTSSTFSTVTSAGGGGGGGGPNPGTGGVGLAGGSGGGGAHYGSSGGAGNTPPVSPAQGFNGGTGQTGSNAGSGGGGGAGAVGGNGCSSIPGQGGPGGAGVTSSINATPTTRAGGGGGGGDAGAKPGGSGGGGAAGNPGVAGSTNTGGGGGGTTSGPACTSGGAGGSGIVIIRYKFQ